MPLIWGDTNSPSQLCVTEVEWHRQSAAVWEAAGLKLHLIPLAIIFPQCDGKIQKGDFFSIISAFRVPCLLGRALLLMQLWLEQLLPGKKKPHVTWFFPGLK